MNRTTDSLQDQLTDVEARALRETLLKALGAFSLKLSAISSRADLLWFSAREIAGPFGLGGCSIYQLDRETASLRQVASSDWPGPRSGAASDSPGNSLGQGIALRVAESATTLIAGT